MYCLVSLVAGGLIVLGWEWFRKRNHQIQEIVVKYRYFVAILIVLSLLGALIGTLINSKGEELGSLADWASAIMSFVAILVVFWQVKRESQNERAFYIENKRPRFTFEKTMNIQKGEIVLRPNERKNTIPSQIKGRLDSNEGALFRITNISANPVYSMKIIFDYNIDYENTYIFHGLPKEKSIVLIPTHFVKRWENIFIRFRSSANEVGYMYCMAENNTLYYFVKDKNTAISTYGNDKLILPNDEIVQAFNKTFEDSSPSSIMFKANETIKKTDK